MTTAYFLKLDSFEGPLDLLLYLIKQNEMDIFEVDLADLAEQYLSHLRLIQFSDLKDASAFLVMGASLCEIKTRRLLPTTETAQGDGDQDEVDLEAQLKERLLEYHKFREIGEFFGSIEKESKKTYSPVAEWMRLESLYAENISPLFGDPSVLVIMYEQLLSELVERKPASVRTNRESITIERVIDQMLESLKLVEVFLFQGMYSKLKSRYELIAHILALLQILRDTKTIRCYQDADFGPLWIYWYDEKNPDSFVSKIKEMTVGELRNT